VTTSSAWRLWTGTIGGGAGLPDRVDSLRGCGLVRDGAYVFTFEDCPAFAYYSFAQRYRSSMSLHVRLIRPPAAIDTEIRAIVSELDPNIAVAGLRTMDEVVSTSGFSARFVPLLTALFPGAGLLLAAIDVYGLLAVQVAQRGREFGVRMALGAKAQDIPWLVVGRGAGVALLGCMLGISLVVGPGRF